ncbi:MAG: PAS domain S-box protein [Ginsengibacter sp.]
MEASARLLAIVQCSQDAIISKKLDGTITTWNSAAERIFGYTAQEAIGDNISIIIPEELLPEEKDIIKKIKRGEIIEHYETIRKRKDGRRISIALTISPIKDENGKTIGASKIARDITGEKESKRNEAMLAAIVDSSDDAIISKTLDGYITSWNFTAEKMFGYPANEAIGKHISIIIPPERIGEEAIIIDNIRNGKKLDHFETVRVAKNGRQINISLTVSPVKNSNGEIIGASKVARDISERAEIERQRQLYTKRLQELNNYKDDFMAMASHELKTPLTIVKSNLQILEHLLATDSNVKFIQLNLKQVDKLTDLVNNLLDISKIQIGKLEINKTVFDLDILMKEIIDNIHQALEGRRIYYKKRDDKLMVFADSSRIEQVIINVLTNAIKYSPGGPDVIVDAFDDDGKIIVSIKDGGIGIPQEDLQNIFTRFYRVRGMASTFSGSGIGLYISSEIVKQHGGEMWVESTIGKGSVFYFTIPAADEA